MTPPVDECRCWLPLGVPDGVKWWRPDLHDEPSVAEAPAVVRYGQRPGMCRWVRIPGGWSERGTLVDFYVNRTPPIPWSRIGECWAGEQHAVVAVNQQTTGNDRLV